MRLLLRGAAAFLATMPWPTMRRRRDSRRKQRRMTMTEAEITALVERIVGEKLAERDQKTVAALAEGMWRGLRQAEASITLDGKRLARIVADQHRRDERRHGSLK